MLFHFLLLLDIQILEIWGVVQIALPPPLGCYDPRSIHRCGAKAVRSRSPRTGAIAGSLLTTVSPQSTFHSAAPTFWYLLVCLSKCWVMFRSTCTFATLFALEGRHVLMNSICSRENEMCYGTTEADGVKVDRTMELLCSLNQNPFVNVD